MASNTRRVVGNISLSLDGRIHGLGGDNDMSWVVPHAVTEVAYDYLARLTQNATTALIGRKNFQGFGFYWPSVATDDAADPRDRAFSEWLNTVEKVVFSGADVDTSWSNSRVARDPASEVSALRTQPGGDIYVLSSSSIIRTLIEADELDRLIINLCPEIVGGGGQLFSDGMPTTSWTLTESTPAERGSVYLTYDR